MIVPATPAAAADAGVEPPQPNSPVALSVPVTATAPASVIESVSPPMLVPTLIVSLVSSHFKYPKSPPELVEPR